MIHRRCYTGGYAAQKDYLKREVKIRRFKRQKGGMGSKFLFFLILKYVKIQSMGIQTLFTESKVYIDIAGRKE